MRRNETIPGVRVYGGAHKGKCPSEDYEMVSFFSRLRREYQLTWGALALHPRNEQLLRNGQFSTVAKHRAQGMTKGASDIIIPGPVAFVCEMKRQDPSLSQWKDGQKEYLQSASRVGCFAVLAFGCDAAWDALQDWIAHVGG
jgi:hypothetical protein